MRAPIFLLIIMFQFVIQSCKEVDEFIPIEDSSVFEFSKEFTSSTDTLEYNINLKEPVIIRTPRGTEFVFKPEMFTFMNGDFCTCESIRVEIIELNKKRDFLVHQASTVSDGEVLISAGAYHIAAFYQSKPLALAEGHLACFWLPSDQLDSEMQLFFGERSSLGFNWNPADRASTSSSITPGQWQYNDTTSFIVGYQCFSDRLTWLNVNKLASSGPKNPVCIKLSESFDSENTVVFAVMTEENSILSLQYDHRNGFCQSTIPEGKQVQFVAIHKKGNDLYQMATETVVIERNHFQSLDFRVVPFEDITDFLAKL